MAIPPNPVGRAVVIIAAVFTGVDLGFILLRLWARRLKHVSLDASDYLIIIAWSIALADMIRKIVAASWGVGTHFNDLVAVAGPSVIIPVNKITYTGFFLWLAIVTFTKLSILFLYRGIFRCVERFVLVVHIMMGVVVAYWLAFTMGTLFQCSPIAFNWDRTIPGGKCMVPKTGFLVSGSVNLVIDVILVVMPIPVVWKMQHVTKMKKIGIIGMFSLGLFICFLAAFRFKFVLATNPLDFNHDGEIAGIPGELELYLGIMGACLPLISPPLLAIRQKVTVGYSSIMGRKRSGYSEGGSDSDSIPKPDIKSEQPSWESMALKSWPDSATDSIVEVSPVNRVVADEANHHTIQCHSEWMVRSDARSAV
ncbi:uncharacterized protein K460DRAFT_341038 [Cucurbitaria berberidis CBS 394.84]|uniref:Rhodopsin domain-containing protein n=1 Tax=Cucurbitaria berberidis CBS 394.84 TaxID=1168544 RepID=A0A9P4L5Y1_9PLEO|nr:uncharacterized protein K460DRAFT_341038 [Cucurbitaria berberidis CBS 394.84]KAF1843185.1 hypothetical protein K460DRAFT_341038 [Cucurbitaria berberidis CBS 394.84]